MKFIYFQVAFVLTVFVFASPSSTAAFGFYYQAYPSSYGKLESSIASSTASSASSSTESSTHTPQVEHIFSKRSPGYEDQDFTQNQDKT